MRTVIAHGHIFKNAGTTLDWALEKNFGKGFCDHRDDKSMREGRAEYLEQFLHENPHIKAISSHHLCDTSSIKSIKIIPIYLLRHPIERIFSVYNFERLQKEKTPGAIAAKGKSFKEYVDWRMQPSVGATIRNYQSMYLSGFHIMKSKETNFECMVTQSIDMAKNSDYIGLVEQFDESMVLIEEKLKESNIHLNLAYVRQNTLNNRESDNQCVGVIEKLGSSSVAVYENNAIDLLIYQLVKRRINRSKQALTGFKKRLAHFKQRCLELSENP